jgi:hypothetical protein
MRLLAPVLVLAALAAAGGPAGASAASSPPPATVRFSQSAPTTTEGSGRVVLGVVRAGRSTSAVSVDYATGGGTAVPGADYVPASGTLTFAPGVRFQRIVVQLKEDSVPDGNRTFGVVLSDPSPGAVVAAPAVAAVTIVDDDSAGRLHFSAPSYTASEADRRAVVTVTRDQGSAGPASVRWTSAGPGHDATGTLRLSAGQLSARFSLRLADDGVRRPDAVVRLTLSDARGAVLGAPATATLVVADADAPAPGGPAARVRMHRRQRAHGHPGVALSIRPNSRERLTATGLVSLGTGHRLRLRAVRALLAPGRSTAVVLRYPKGAWGRIGKAQRQGHRVRATITLRLTDPVGRHLTLHRHVRIVP